MYPQKIKKLREKMIMSQEELATLLGTNKVTISRWENGKFEPTYKYKKLLNELFIKHGISGDQYGI
jgi:DNA-binding transcriptional regulator YiaG